LWVPFEAHDFDIFAVGGTAAFQYFADRLRIFSVGGRLAFLDARGYGDGFVAAFIDAEVSARPRLFARRASAFEIVLSAGAGAGFIAGVAVSSPPPTGMAHLAARGGLGFDVGAFTMDALAGVTTIANGGGASGAVEVLVEAGARF
jgi:hypothetical protein